MQSLQRRKKANLFIYTCGGVSSLFSSASSFNFAGILFLPPINAGKTLILKSRDFLRFFLEFRFLGEDEDLDGDCAGEGECLPLPVDSSWLLGKMGKKLFSFRLLLILASSMESLRWWWCVRWYPGSSILCGDGLRPLRSTTSLTNKNRCMYFVPKWNIYLQTTSARLIISSLSSTHWASLRVFFMGITYFIPISMSASENELIRLIHFPQESWYDRELGKECYYASIIFWWWYSTM